MQPEQKVTKLSEALRMLGGNPERQALFSNQSQSNDLSVLRRTGPNAVIAKDHSNEQKALVNYSEEKPNKEGLQDYRSEVLKMKERLKTMYGVGLMQFAQSI